MPDVKPIMSEVKQVILDSPRSTILGRTSCETLVEHSPLNELPEEVKHLINWQQGGQEIRQLTVDMVFNLIFLNSAASLQKLNYRDPIIQSYLKPFEYRGVTLFKLDENLINWYMALDITTRKNYDKQFNQLYKALPATLDITLSKMLLNKNNKKENRHYHLLLCMPFYVFVMIWRSILELFQLYQLRKAVKSYIDHFKEMAADSILSANISECTLTT